MVHLLVSESDTTSTRAAGFVQRHNQFSVPEIKIHTYTSLFL